jgi:hypothetical protein
MTRHRTGAARRRYKLCAVTSSSNRALALAARRVQTGPA